jgi:Outer membrane protein beta-barrel domain
MEHIDNDMDDLFQKAGELYPLKTTESDWDAVAGKLQDESFGDENYLSGLTAGGTRNKRRWLLLLLLIPFGLGIAYTSGLLNQKNKGSLSNKTSVLPDQKKNQAGIPATNNNAGKSGETVSNKTSGESRKTQTLSVIHVVTEGRSKKELSSANGKLQTNAGRGKQLTTKDTGNSKTELVTDAGRGKQWTAKGTGNSKTESLSEAVGAKTDLNTSPSNNPSIQNQQVALPVPPPASGQNETAAEKKNPEAAEKVKSDSADSITKLKKTDAKTNTNKGFYVGLIAGPDISSVEFQSVKQSGFSLGATVGYRFNKKLSVETGFLFDKKYYYSDGAHYKNQQPGYTIINVDGNCNMFEIPLLLRYDFSSGQNHGFFAKAGFSSYLMTKQNYSANSDYYGMPQPTASWTNSKHESYFFSVIQLSGGYEFSISRKTKIQIEPYVKIPLQGIGQGSMPISSAGIYFGITHSFR